MLRALFGVLDKSLGDVAPNFQITFHGTTYDFIDFSIFDDYQKHIHSSILLLVYFRYIMKLFKQLPSIIGGFGSL